MILLSMVFCLTANNCCVSSDSNAISKGLKTMEKEIPLPYHRDLVKSVEKYKKEELPELFLNCEGFLEEALKSRDFPTELKYLPVSLSWMQPNYQNGDRCGVWALPTLVGLRYGLVIDGQNDERYSIEASTRAALDYLSDLHDKYNDWWHVILAYANSPVALQHALSKREDTLKLWDFYVEDLVPNSEIICDFIACMYVYREHQPLANPRPISEISPVVKQTIPDDTTIKTPTQPEEPVITVQEEPQPKEETPKPTEKIIKYKVKKGDTLTRIAKQHHVTVSNLMEWNHLESDLIRDGQILIIKK